MTKINERISFRNRSRAALFLTFLASLSVLPAALLSATANAGPSVTFDIYQGPVGTGVTATGTDWPPGWRIEAFFYGIEEPITKAPITVDPNGNFMLTFCVPDLPPGIYPTFFTSDHSGMYSGPIFTITAGSAVNCPFTPSPLADLSPTAIQYNPADLVLGKTVFFDSGVQNSGSQGTGVFKIRWFVDDVIVDYSSHAGVPANTTVLDGNSQYSWPVTAGTHTISFVVDSDNHVVESNESNNSTSVTVTVGPSLSSLVLERALTLSGEGEGDIDNEQTIFAPSEGIRYAAIVNNTTTSKVTSKFDFLATGPREIFSWTGNIDISPGKWLFWFHVSVPPVCPIMADHEPVCENIPYTETKCAPFGTYTHQVTMTYDVINRAIKESSFTVFPESEASNLVVLVHGCCTDEEGVEILGEVGCEIQKKIKDQKKEKDWDIVVWDWHEYTPAFPPFLDILFKQAYKAAKDKQGPKLATAIANHRYKHIHLIGHSAGAKLIDTAAKHLISKKTIKKQKPFIHLTFLDAYTDTAEDSGEEGGKNYGYLEKYPTNRHYAEHYVDIGLPGTDACLAKAFNFDITDWTPADKSGWPFDGPHQWPHRWYKQSVTSSGFKYGYPLSLEGVGGPPIDQLYKQYPPGKQCPLESTGTKCNKKQQKTCREPGEF